jgi:hypothetical protein
VVWESGTKKTMPNLEDTEISCGVRQLHGLCRDTNRYRAEDKIAPKDVILEAFGAESETDEIDWRDSSLTEFSDVPTTITEINFGIIIFSDSARRGNGKDLAKYITANKLGTVIPSEEVMNPNTKRKIQMWIWQLDRSAIIKWLKKNHKPKEVPVVRPAYRVYDWNGRAI